MKISYLGRLKLITFTIARFTVLNRLLIGYTAIIKIYVNAVKTAKKLQTGINRLAVKTAKKLQYNTRKEAIKKAYCWLQMQRKCSDMMRLIKQANNKVWKAFNEKHNKPQEQDLSRGIHLERRK